MVNASSDPEPWPLSSLRLWCLGFWRLPGDEGATRLATALAQLKQLKELRVELDNNNIGAGPKGRAWRTPRPRSETSHGILLLCSTKSGLNLKVSSWRKDSRI